MVLLKGTNVLPVFVYTDYCSPLFRDSNFSISLDWFSKQLSCEIWRSLPAGGGLVSSTWLVVLEEPCCPASSSLTSQR